MHSFYLIHRKTMTNHLPLDGDFPIWKTCLRQIGFIPAPQDPQQLATFNDLKSSYKDELLTNEEALSFLISVLCGLESPVLGETEVMGQFKNFMQNHQNSSHPLLCATSPLFQFLLSEVKDLRDQHVRNLGSNSYGSLLRKELKTFEKITILGSGHFAEEILPWLKEKTQVLIWCRCPKKAAESLSGRFNNLEFLSTQFSLPADYEKSGLIIAAPIEDKTLLPLLPKATVDLIIDCRGEKHLMHGNQLQQKTHRFVDLQGLTAILDPGLKATDPFSDQSEQKDCKLSVVNELKKMIHLRVQNFFDKPKIRPQGWEDLCA